jgi:tetratricopeptide (TPR) repeat protein
MPDPGRRRALLPLLAVLASACGGDAPGAPPPGPGPAYVGRAACASCHAAAAEAFTGSDHDRAMDEATEATVLGDFADATLTVHGVTTRFLRRDGRFVVRTEGPDGREADFVVARVFGVDPLQQYLVEFPGGRVQALPFCWDARPREAGGQRWFHVYGEERVPPADLLFWTRGAQNWNHMCADCHSTGVRKEWREPEREFRTSWKEIDVSCEACHGPGSGHTAWARAGAKGAAVPMPVPLGKRGRESWTMDPATGTAVLSRPSGGEMEVETCARCHARVSVLDAEYAHGRPLLDSRMPAVLEEGLYHADGQVLEEVYEYGSFLQSRMYARGVSCRDCHDPHSLRLRARGNATCASCHDPARFDVPGHHRHLAGAACVDCHMPAKTFMGVDARRDHSLRVPRPDLTLSLGSPNACNAAACHGDRDAAWAQAAVARWYPEGRWREPHWGSVLDAGRRRLPGAGAALAAAAADPAVPGIARATAVSLLGDLGGAAAARALPAAAADADPLVRAMAARAARVLPPAERARLLALLAGDGLRGVRVEAGRSSVGLPGEAFAAALAEWRRSQEIHGDRAEAHLNLGAVAALTGDGAAAEAAYRQARRIEPLLPGSWINLADLQRARGDDAAAEATLREGLAGIPGDADLLHALGLTLVRRGRGSEARPPLAEAARRAPGIARYALVHALAVDAGGERAEALRILEESLRRHPADAGILAALVDLHRASGDGAAARPFAERLAEVLREGSGEAGPR